MRILLLADIHGNFPAFEAVLRAASSISYDELWCLGDVVGYGPFPNECVALLQQKARRVVVGNHDAKVISSKKIQQIIDARKEAYKVFVFSWTHRMLTDASVEHLKALPQDMRVDMDGRRVFLAHGSPKGIDDGVTMYTPEAYLSEIAALAGADILLLGHTHEAFSREAGGALFINPGSVGRPFDGDTRASFSIVEFSADGVHVANHRVAYDQESVVREMERQGFPRVLVKAFSGACSPADVLPDGSNGGLVEEAQKFAGRCRYEKKHALHVSALALKIFDGLKELHDYGPRERALLQAGALLHDVGIMHGVERHHKSGRDMILEEAKGLPVSDRERVILALLVRYHRKSLPKEEHRHFHGLPDYHKLLVMRLGGILRLADGLDRTHQALVEDLQVEVGVDFVRMHLSAQKDIAAELEFGKIKSDLLQKAFSRRIILETV